MKLKFNDNALTTLKISNIRQIRYESCTRIAEDDPEFTFLQRTILRFVRLTGANLCTRSYTPVHKLHVTFLQRKNGMDVQWLSLYYSDKVTLLKDYKALRVLFNIVDLKGDNDV